MQEKNGFARDKILQRSMKKSRTSLQKKVALKIETGMFRIPTVSQKVISMTAESPDKAADARAISFLRDLIAAQADGESAVQKVIVERLTAAGCEISELTYDPSTVPAIGDFGTGAKQASGARTAVVGTYKGDPGKCSLLVFAHPDGEKLQTDHGWERDPFAGTIDKGRIYGWGVADDLAGCAAAVLAIEEAARVGTSLGTVVFASTPSKKNARGVAALLHEGLSADASLYLHPAESGVGMQEIKAVTPGHLDLKIVVPGRLPDTNEPSHTAFSHRAVNPVDKAILIIAALQTLAEARVAQISHPMIDAFVGRSTNILVSYVKSGNAARFSRVPELCELGVAISFPPHETMREVQDEIEAALKACFDADPWLAEHSPTLEWLSGSTGAEVPHDHPLFCVASNAVQHVTGKIPFVNPLHAASDIRNPAVEKGIPTVAFGGLCGDLTQNDKRDEWVDVADFHRMVRATTEVVTNWCARSRNAGCGK